MVNIVDLRRGQVWGADSEAGEVIRIQCETGYLWLTKEGDRVDFLIPTGTFQSLQGPGKIVVEALVDSRLQIQRRHRMSEADNQSAA